MRGRDVVGESDPRSPAVCCRVVLDTNIVLDLWVFQDAACIPLHADLTSGALQWIATAPMRDELARVLAYPQIVRSLAHHRIAADDVLREFEQRAMLVAVAAKAAVTCKDPDDQKFMDLAVTHQCLLLSKDHAVLCMKKRLSALGVTVAAAYDVAAK